MEDFLDEYLPDSCRGFPYRSTPRTSTTIVTVSSGVEQRNRNWVHPLFKFTGPEIIRCWETIEDLKDHWMVMGGPELSFPFQDPMDFASIRLVKPGLAPTVFETDQVIGIGDGANTDFQLIKTYTRGSGSYSRNITLPVLSTVLVAIDGVLQTSGYTVSRTTGLVVFTSPPAMDEIVTAGFLFDVPVRFEDDNSFDVILSSYQTGGAADLTFLEVRPC